MKDYSKAKIYRLDLPTGDFYIGSKIQSLSMRRGKHVAKSRMEERKNTPLYKAVADLPDGWDCVVCTLVEKIPCNDIEELLKRERYYIEHLSSTLNKIIPGRKAKEYYEINKEALNEKSRRYYKENKQIAADRSKQYRQDNNEYIREYKKQYHQANKESLAIKARQYRHDNVEAIKEKKKEYHQLNKEALNEKSNQYQETNKEVLAEYRKTYHQANKDVQNEKQRIRNQETHREAYLAYQKAYQSVRFTCPHCQKEMSRRCIKAHIARHES